MRHLFNVLLGIIFRPATFYLPFGEIIFHIFVFSSRVYSSCIYLLMDLYRVIVNECYKTTKSRVTNIDNF